MTIVKLLRTPHTLRTRVESGASVLGWAERMSILHVSSRMGFEREYKLQTILNWTVSSSDSINVLQIILFRVQDLATIKHAYHRRKELATQEVSPDVDSHDKPSTQSINL